MISFEILSDTGKDKEIGIYCDKAGLAELIRQLKLLESSGSGPNHLHLATPSWGGNELSEKANKTESATVHQVTIMVRD